VGTNITHYKYGNLKSFLFTIICGSRKRKRRSVIRKICCNMQERENKKNYVVPTIKEERENKVPNKQIYQIVDHPNSNTSLYTP